MDIKVNLREEFEKENKEDAIRSVNGRVGLVGNMNYVEFLENKILLMDMDIQMMEHRIAILEAENRNRTE
jgi:hypothetical protein